jgi:diaminohydroxyphosphoribosylaminopyrimidine deaminase/5-amino-6-(5-phosphoribosylamino)uracil reductase
MRAALGLARRGLGSVWPNPSVGCVLVNDGAVVGRGWTQPGGRPHAEPQALIMAGDKARGATAYVTLEPCSHYGKTPPCAEALIAAGISRCVCALQDSDPRVSGRGVEMLRAAGIAVEVGLCATEARHLNQGFFLRVEQQRPLVTLKLATTLDGRIALANGESKWITGPEARAAAHRIRAEHDAILVGVGTVIADNPDLRCRLPGMDKRPLVRVVLDSKGRAPIDCALLTDDGESWILGSAEAPAAFPQGETKRWFRLEPDTQGRPSPQAVLRCLAAQGITRLMIEGGGQVAASFLAAGLVDRLAWFRASKVIGGDGLAAISALGLDRLTNSPDFASTELRPVGADHLELYERR